MSISEQAVVLLRALSVRAVALTVAALAVATWVGGVLQGSGWTLSFDADLGIPILFGGLLALAAAGLLWAARAAPGVPADASRRLRVASLALALIGVEAALNVHERLGEGLELSAAVAAAPLLALTAITAAFVWALPAGRARSALLAGLLLWGASLVADALGEGGGAVAALLYLAATPLLVAGALAEAQERWEAPGGEATPPAAAALGDLLALIDAGHVARAILALVVAVIGLGVLYHAGVLSLQTLDLRSQQGANQVLSFALMVVAGGLALLRGRLSEDPWHAWTLLGCVFWVMAVNDLVAGHQQIGEETGVRGQFILFPIVIAAAVGWLGCLRRSGERGRRLLLIGAACWVLSQGIDVIAPEGRFHWWVPPEETLELLGMTAFVTALLLAVQAAAWRAPGVERRDAAVPARAATQAGGA